MKFLGWYDLDENDNPIPLPDGQVPQDRQHHRVGLDTVGTYEVSTVFLGLDHRHFGDGPPVLWETMVFAQESGFEDLLCERYTSKAAAKSGHDYIVAELRDGKKPDEIELPS